MAPNPLTSPSDSGAAHGTAFTLESPDYPGQQQSTATPLNPFSMALYGSEEYLDSRERSDYYDQQSLADEDQDMSDGGAPIGPSRADDGDVEMDPLNVESLGVDGNVDMFHSIIDAGFSDPHQSLIAPAQTADDMWSTGLLPGGYLVETPDAGDDDDDDDLAPNTLSVVAQQLQQIQDGQQHGIFSMPALFGHAGAADSTLPVPSSPSYIYQTGPQAEGTQLGGITVVFAESDDYVILQNHSFQLGSPQLFLPTLLTLIGQLENPDADWIEVEEDHNVSLADFLYLWATAPPASDMDFRRRIPTPLLEALIHQRSLTNLAPMVRSELQGDVCDFQRINWRDLGITRTAARQRRRQTYVNYMNIRSQPQWHPRLNGSILSAEENYFRFRRMDFDHHIQLSHFQLRNLLGCASRDHIFYAGRERVMHYSPSGTRPASVSMDLSNPVVQPTNFSSDGIRVSALTVGHDVLVVGGFNGEYAMVNVKAEKKSRHTEGVIVNHANSITNHVEVNTSRGGSILAAFSSNENGLRLLDVATNKFVAEHMYEQPVNCSAISPDQRLRVLVGDTQKVMICNAETGEILQELEGHRDHGFACDWADDGWTVATGNQDMQIKIWDARKWRSSSGATCPVTTISAEMAGVRKLKFSPVGSGQRVLVAAEPADFVNIIDAQTFAGKQILSFFGEIGGIDFTNDGQDLFVANCDGMRGGILEFERCGFAGVAYEALNAETRGDSWSNSNIEARGYDWKDTDGEIVSHWKSHGTRIQRDRRPAADAMAPF